MTARCRRLLRRVPAKRRGQCYPSRAECGRWKDGAPIVALDYEVYEPMARQMLRQIGEELADRHKLSTLCVEHSTGRVGVSQCSVRLQISSPHRQEALTAMIEFIDRLKQDVPIWKTPVTAGEVESSPRWGGSCTAAPLREIGDGSTTAIPTQAGLAELSHVDAFGRVKMVDVGSKTATSRRAVAEGRVRVSPELAAKIRANTLAKGDLLEVARLAAIQAAKRTDELIPLAHNLPLDHIHAEAWLDGRYVRLRAAVSTTAKTGVEMEALVAVSVGALAVIDMGKAVDRAMVVEEVRLVEKTGGSRGDFHATELPLKETPS